MNILVKVFAPEFKLVLKFPSWHCFPRRCYKISKKESPHKYLYIRITNQNKEFRLSNLFGCPTMMAIFIRIYSIVRSMNSFSLFTIRTILHNLLLKYDKTIVPAQHLQDINERYWRSISIQNPSRFPASNPQNSFQQPQQTLFSFMLHVYLFTSSIFHYSYLSVTCILSLHLTYDENYEIKFRHAI